MLRSLGGFREKPEDILLWVIGIAVACSFAIPAYQYLSVWRSVSVCENRYETECAKNMLLGIIRDKGLPSGMEAVKVWHEHRKKNGPLCDAVTRGIGAALAHEYGKGYAALEFTPESAWCNYGIYHGFVKTFLEESDYDLEATRDFCEYVGTRVRDGAPGVEAECFRALGYGVAISHVSDNDSVSDIRAGAARCEALARDPEDSKECIWGVFGEAGRILGANPVWIQNTDPLEICEEFEGEMAKSCYSGFKWLPYVTLDLTGLEPAAGFEKMISVLGTPDSEAKKETVFQLLWTLAYSAGIRATTYDKKERYAYGMDSCLALPETYVNRCIQAFAFGLAKGSTPGLQYLDVIGFCRQAEKVSRQAKNECYQASFVYLSDFYPAWKKDLMCRIGTSQLGAKCES